MRSRVPRHRAEIFFRTAATHGLGLSEQVRAWLHRLDVDGGFSDRLISIFKNTGPRSLDMALGTLPPQMQRCFSIRVS